MNLEKSHHNMPLRAVLSLIFLAFTANMTQADTGPDSGLAVPRFVSLAADEVNLRTGPGFRYPVAWVFIRESLPVEVIGEFNDWRHVRDHDGAEGWVHRAMLSGRRTVLVTGGVRALMQEPRPESSTIARVEAGVQGRLNSCHSGWCEIDLGGTQGWMPRDHLWGVTAVRRDP